MCSEQWNGEYFFRIKQEQAFALWLSEAWKIENCPKKLLEKKCLKKLRTLEKWARALLLAWAMLTIISKFLGGGGLTIAFYGWASLNKNRDPTTFTFWDVYQCLISQSGGISSLQTHTCLLSLLMRSTGRGGGGVERSLWWCPLSLMIELHWKCFGDKCHSFWMAHMFTSRLSIKRINNFFRKKCGLREPVI
jgi:hypothetical protein